MSETTQDNLLSRLTGRESDSDPSNPWDALESANPAHEPNTAADPKLEGLLQRISSLTTAPGADAAQADEPIADAEPEVISDGFVPVEPRSFQEARLTDSDVESLILKLLLNRGDCIGRDIGDHIKLPFVLVDDLLRQLKLEQLVVYRGSAPMNDYCYQLTDLGRERARRYSEHCTYFGAAPVSLSDYIESVSAQSLQDQHPTEEDLTRAFDDLLINRHMLARLGPAINSGRGMFLFGFPGNGKTSIAERVTRAFGQAVWIPRSIGVDGEIIRMFDPVNHEELPLAKNEGLLKESKIDERWVCVRRPTIVVGGELTMDNLEVSFNSSTGISEAPMQLKSNCGTLVIDDFGRQRMSTDELLNRWIVPLEKRYDFLNLSNGKKIQVPFDQLIVFSTNLEPRDLVDDAFLRRIPYKIEVVDPSEDEFRELFKIMCPIIGFDYNQEAVDYLIEKHYRETGRPFRCCQPRDLLSQVRSHCLYQKIEMKLSPEFFDFACENYFAVM